MQARKPNASRVESTVTGEVIRAARLKKELGTRALLRSGGKKRNAGVSGFTGKGGDGACFAFRDTGKCKFGQKCEHKHENGSPPKKAKLTKAQKKGAMVAAVKTLAKKIKKNSKEEDGKQRPRRRRVGDARCVVLFCKDFAS
jgi:hypothetical protein